MSKRTTKTIATFEVRLEVSGKYASIHVLQTHIHDALINAAVLDNFESLTVKLVKKEISYE